MFFILRLEWTDAGARTSANQGYEHMLNDVSDDFEAALLAALPSDVIKEIEPRYLEEPRGRYAGQTTLMAVPQTVE